MRVALARFVTAPSESTLPEGFTRIDSALRQGVPHAVALAGNQRLLLIAPSGVARPWRDADPFAVVSEASVDRAPAGDAAPAVAIAPRMPLRLLFQAGGRTVAAIPLVAGARRLADGEGATPVEIVVLDWRLHAGTLVGAGDYGSFIALGWRSAAASVAHFSDPPPNPVYVQRQPPDRRMQSMIGERVIRLNARFAYKRVFVAKIR